VGWGGVPSKGSAGSTVVRGKSAEHRAAAYLIDRGYAIVARNWRCRLGELDLIAMDGDVLAFIEVRSRADAAHGSPLETIRAGKQRKVAQVASAYLASHTPRAASCRFDVVGITGDDIVLIKDAFRVS
jgi:putative endonuclease